MRRIIALAVVGVIVILLVVGQLVLPGIAADQLRDRLARSGRVLHVEVDAFPAFELLWHHADKVVIRMADYDSSATHLGNSLGEAMDAAKLDASAAEVRVGLLTLRDATMHKRGNQLTGSARVTEADLRTAVPFLDSVRPLAGGRSRLTLRGTATVLGVTATVDATVSAQDGKLVVVPDVPFGGFATVTVFNSPHVAITGVSGRRSTGGFAVRGRAVLH